MTCKSDVGALLDERDDLVGVIHVGRQHGRHERRRIMGLEITCLIGQQRVGGGVRLVEAVARELLHEVEDERGLLLIDTAGNRAIHEDGPLLRHLLGLLLTHRATQQVRAAERVAGEHLRDLHDLLLIQDHAIRRLQTPA